MINSEIDHLVRLLSKLPGLGLRSARRIVLHLLNNKEMRISCKGVFIAIGHAPSNELILDQLKTHNGGYVVTKPNSTETSIPGVFAAGDIIRGASLLLWAIKDGRDATLSIKIYLQNLKEKKVA